MRLKLGLLAALALACAPSGERRTTRASGDGGPLAAAHGADDPYLWLEEIEGRKALAWARARNEETLEVLESDPRFAPMRAKAEAVLQAADRIPYGELAAGYVWNFWQDERSVRGLWRRATLEEYRKPQPAWEVLLDVDALAKAEKENWVYEGASCLPPERRRCLVMLSRGGKDAYAVREFDVPSRAFVPGGFELPEAKSGVSWLDQDHLLVGTDFGPGSLTASGYPRVIKRWRRATPLASAELVFEGRASDVSAWSMLAWRPEGSQVLVGRSVTFYESEQFLLAPDGRLQRIPLPKDAKTPLLFKGRLVAELRSGWRLDGRVFPEGSIVSLRAADVLAGKAEPPVELVYAPDERSAVRELDASRDRLLVGVLREVRGRVLGFGLERGRWKARGPLPLPEGGSLDVVSAYPDSESILADYTGFLEPSRLYLLEPGRKPEVLKRLPERFDARGMVVEQHQATSRDGERVPYFLVRPRDAGPDGHRPTLLYGYGGFEYPMLPSYLAIAGNLWLKEGGLYALANIRGGGEFGPRWHRAALQENRQRAYDDFIAVAEDLVRSGWTSPRRLGIMGGSNGGLLVGAVMTQRPELFQAVVCQVPLLDMLRYTKLLAGPSWVAEYGDPDAPRMRPVIAAYSPYQNLRRGVDYPAAFIHTSTKDDRVHPGHARKMAAKLRSLGQDVLYYENIEGGHGAAANLLQRARRYALEYVFLLRQLKGQPPAVQ